jgi:hypothetical protein
VWSVRRLGEVRGESKCGVAGCGLRKVLSAQCEVLRKF